MTNNNESMATVVETFYVEETTNLIHDQDALNQWNAKVEELELAGQKTVVKEDKSPIPFLWMNNALIATFETLCPSKSDVKAFDKSPIPVEILQTISLCQKEKYFDLVEVWFNEQDKDPVVIGYSFDPTKEGQTEWYQKHYAKKYLIARWADVKASLDQLVERARKMFIADQSQTAKTQIKYYQRQLEDAEDAAAQRFGNAMPSTSLPF